MTRFDFVIHGRTYLRVKRGTLYFRKSGWSLNSSGSDGRSFCSVVFRIFVNYHKVACRTVFVVTPDGHRSLRSRVVVTYRKGVHVPYTEMRDLWTHPLMNPWTLKWECASFHIVKCEVTRFWRYSRKILIKKWWKLIGLKIVENQMLIL